jgi:predicted nucleotidyltransferase
MPDIAIDRTALKAFCQQHEVRKLSLFGSVLRDDFRADSDVDVLIEFGPGKSVGFIALGEMEQRLSQLLGGHAVDLVTPKFLNHRIRDRVLADAEVLYAEV